MVQAFLCPARRFAAAGPFVAGQAAVCVVATLAALFAMPHMALAQRSPIHYFNRGGLPPGAIGSQQLLRGGPLPGYFQPAEIEAPEGASISLAVEGQFRESRKGTIKAGMLLGQVYYFRITGLRDNQGFEVYPTVEVINRLYPPPGQEGRFPIPIQITQEECELALEGKFVTRIVYLENPNDPFPKAQDPRLQRYFEIHPNDDPLEVADRLGRPMAILRLGSRVPDSSESSYSLGDRGAPLLLFPPAKEEALPPAKPDKAPAKPPKPAPAPAEPVPPADEEPAAKARPRFETPRGKGGTPKMSGQASRSARGLFALTKKQLVVAGDLP